MDGVGGNDLYRRLSDSSKYEMEAIRLRRSFAELAESLVHTVSKLDNRNPLAAEAFLRRLRRTERVMKWCSSGEGED
jgi:hypothetical protein